MDQPRSRALPRLLHSQPFVRFGIAIDTARIKGEQAMTQVAPPMMGAPAAPQGGMPMPQNNGGM